MSMDDRTIVNELQNGSTQSLLACKSCRRKKLKCDRSIPQCRNCMKVSRDCEYPAVAQKPGPRPGTHRRTVGTTKPSEGTNGRSITTKEPLAELAPSSAGNHVNGHAHETPATSSPDVESGSTNGTAFSNACIAMHMSEQMCWRIIKIFFDNMTTFSLFHLPTFSTKLASIQSEKEVRALLMSMFIFSFRYMGSERSVFGPDATSRTILETAHKLSNECLLDCSDERPPLHLLQSFLLQALSLSNYRVQGRSWRLVGLCIRIAYQLRLHELDLEPFTAEVSSEKWVAIEEKRRAWWAVWECDVFAATILRLPVGADWTRNRTCLPSCNDAWFNSTPVPSCWFNVDPNKRWRDLRDCGNTSELAWFLVINSYKWEALAVTQRIAPPTTFFDNEDQIRGKFDATDYKPVTQRRREMLENCLHCAMSALPPILQVNDYLSFQPSPPPYPVINLARDCGRYMIQVMKGVILLLLSRKDLEAGQYIAFPTDLSQPIPSATSEPTSYDKHKQQQCQKQQREQSQRRWQRCLLESDKIAQITRNTSPTYHRYLNANAATALWMAAAAQHAVLAYHRDEIDVDYLHSNLDILTTTMESFVRFWDVPETLVQSLSTLEKRLRTMTSCPKIKQALITKAVNSSTNGNGYNNGPQGASGNSSSSEQQQQQDESDEPHDPSTAFDNNHNHNNHPPLPTDTSAPDVPDLSDGGDTMDLSPFDVLQAMDFGAMYNGVENWENLFLDPGYPQGTAEMWY